MIFKSFYYPEQSLTHASFYCLYSVTSRFAAVVILIVQFGDILTLVINIYNRKGNCYNFLMMSMYITAALLIVQLRIRWISGTYSMSHTRIQFTGSVRRYPGN